MERFKDIIWFDQAQDSVVLVIGAGGIGSWFSLLASRTGMTLVIFDDDVVDETNISGQMYSLSSVGNKKTEALKTFIDSMVPGNINNYVSEKYSGQVLPLDITVSCVDNMVTRKLMFEKWLEGTATGLFVDGRLEAEFFQVYAVHREDPVQVQAYKDSLFDDDEIEQVACTMKQTSHVAAMIASNMVSIITNHLTNVKVKESVRNVPFFTEVFIPIMKITQAYGTESKQLSLHQ